MTEVYSLWIFLVLAGHRGLGDSRVPSVQLISCRINRTINIVWKRSLALLFLLAWFVGTVENIRLASGTWTLALGKRQAHEIGPGSKAVESHFSLSGTKIRKLQVGE